MKAVIVVSFISVFGLCIGGHLFVPTSLKIGCTSSGDEFKTRLMSRENAVDHTTVWLFRGEQLTMNFELSGDAIVAVLDLRYSNDGDSDEISLNYDDEHIGNFKTDRIYAWGVLWNVFKSSGPIGKPRYLSSGNHSLTVDIQEADEYGVEIDYIRLNVQGAILKNRPDFLCVHKTHD